MEILLRDDRVHFSPTLVKVHSSRKLHMSMIAPLLCLARSWTLVVLLPDLLLRCLVLLVVDSLHLFLVEAIIERGVIVTKEAESRLGWRAQRLSLAGMQEMSLLISHG